LAKPDSRKNAQEAQKNAPDPRLGSCAFCAFLRLKFSSRNAVTLQNSSAKRAKDRETQWPKKRSAVPGTRHRSLDNAIDPFCRAFAALRDLRGSIAVLRPKPARGRGLTRTWKRIATVVNVGRG